MSCIACNVTVTDPSNHKRTKAHINAMKNTPFTKEQVNDRLKVECKRCGVRVTNIHTHRKTKAHRGIEPNYKVPAHIPNGPGYCPSCNEHHDNLRTHFHDPEHDNGKPIHHCEVCDRYVKRVREHKRTRIHQKNLDAEEHRMADPERADNPDAE
jgi:hypothetical protein